MLFSWLTCYFLLFFSPDDPEDLGIFPDAGTRYLGVSCSVTLTVCTYIMFMYISYLDKSKTCTRSHCDYIIYIYYIYKYVCIHVCKSSRSKPMIEYPTIWTRLG